MVLKRKLNVDHFCFREVPQELIGMAKGGEVNLNMEDHRNEDYVKPKVQMKAFSGEGHMLGSPTPTVTQPSGGASAAPSANVSVNIDQSKPITQLQIRLADGSRYQNTSCIFSLINVIAQPKLSCQGTVFDTFSFL